MEIWGRKQFSKSSSIGLQAHHCKQYIEMKYFTNGNWAISPPQFLICIDEGVERWIENKKQSRILAVAQTFANNI